MIRSWFGGARFESDEVPGQFRHHVQDFIGRRQLDQQPAWQAALQMGKGIGPIDLVAIQHGFQALSLNHRQCVKVVRLELGPEVLLGGQHRQPRRILPSQAVLEPLERLLDAPTAVIERTEIRSRVSLGIEQGGHQGMHTPIRRHHTNHPHRRGLGLAFIGQAIGRIGGAQGDQPFRLARTQEILHRRKAAGVDPHAEMTSLLNQMGGQPARRIAPV